MDSNPFLTTMKIAFTAIVAFLLLLTFWQGTHVEEQVAALTRENSALTDKVGDLARKVDDLKGRADRLDGKADAVVTMLASGARVGPADGGAKVVVPPARTEWGWAANEGLDAALDASKPAGTPGRYRNFVSLDPVNLIPPESKGHEDGLVGTAFGPQEKSFNPILSTSASMQEEIELYVTDAPAGEHWGDPYKYAPALCWRVEVSPDFREYTLFFRKDVVWQPLALDLSKYPHLRGSHPVTAKDYKFTIDTILNPQVEAASLRSYFDDCEGVTLVDDFTAVVRWKRTVYHSISFTLGRALLPEFLYAYDADGTRFPPETFGQQFNAHFYNRISTPGCGPYRMLPYDGGEWITLERFEDWYGAREGSRYPVKTKRLLVYQDNETPFLKLQAGELGILGLTASQWKKHVLDDLRPENPFQNGTFVTYKGLRPVYYYVGWKNTHPLFRDKAVRRALALACDVSTMAEKIFLGRLVPMSSPIFPGSPSADPDLKPLGYDLKEAARILDERGWKLNPETGVREGTVDGKTRKFEFELVWRSPSPEVEALINQYRNDLRAIGVVMTPVPLEWSLYLEKLHDRDFEASFGGWGSQAWDQDFEQIWTSKQIQEPKSSNYIEYSNPEVDRLSDALRTEMDVEARKEKARRVGRLLFEDQPVCFVGWSKTFGAHAKWLKNPIERQFKTRPFIRTLPMWVDR
ncbi:MAG: hypothetical protein IT460_00585 [Planctomycetes bacterium]|nr:hypothetical protein [Planctomycetota bacterium]